MPQMTNTGLAGGMGAAAGADALTEILTRKFNQALALKRQALDEQQVKTGQDIANAQIQHYGAETERQKALDAKDAENERRLKAAEDQHTEMTNKLLSDPNISDDVKALIRINLANIKGVNSVSDLQKKPQPEKSFQAESGMVDAKGRPVTYDPKANQFFDLDGNPTKDVRRAPPQANPDAQAAREASVLDRSYTYNQNRIDKIRQPLQDRAERLSRLDDSVFAHSAQADSLIAPELVTVVAGGQGTGVRITQGEIDNVMHGRSNWEAVKAAVNKWNPNNKEALSITDAQRADVVELLKMVRDRNGEALKAADDASDKLINASSVTEHRQIVNDFHKQIASIASRSNAASDQSASTQKTAVPTNVQNALKGKAPGTWPLSDGTFWKIDANGGISQVTPPVKK